VAVVVAADAAAGFEPKAHNWLGAARVADSWHSLGLFLDSEIALSHSVHKTMLAVALWVVLLLHDAAGAQYGPLGAAMIGPFGEMMGAFRVVFP
jgi:hypothetical protein